ncbi:tRNA (cmo5U34)-methyltransferase [Paenibacillus sp. JGP012]|uniref:class I SAM-dependent methyltransferase n=1 Tax=Paenibacillus sp. JGP012 TaxID=2735914 RepID=UPI0017961EF8|nr:class I SAM-dependent methyltransferase [Paenibacillus sp. JGP012]MBB6023853.1 tRNA (cmo5U34)-methyltransferase [Paenibacillus sp. JGP012]
MKDHIYDKITQLSESPAMSWDTADLYRYEQSIPLKIPGYEHMHHMMEKLLAASIADNNDIHILVTGAGGGKELMLLGSCHQEWRFTGLDTSSQMLGLAQQRIEEAGITDRATLLHGKVEQLPEAVLYDGATSMLMLHFIQGIEAKKSFLKHLAHRLKPGAPFIIASVNVDLSSPAYPVMMKAWQEHMLQAGVLDDEWERFAASLGQQSDPISTEVAMQLLEECGFSQITRYFGAFWVEGYYAYKD